MIRIVRFIVSPPLPVLYVIVILAWTRIAIYRWLN
jgi:hypothetical protein